MSLRREWASPWMSEVGATVADARRMARQAQSITLIVNADADHRRGEVYGLDLSKLAVRKMLASKAPAAGLQACLYISGLMAGDLFIGGSMPATPRGIFP